MVPNIETAHYLFGNTDPVSTRRVVTRLPKTVLHIPKVTSLSRMKLVIQIPQYTGHTTWHASDHADVVSASWSEFSPWCIAPCKTESKKAYRGGGCCWRRRAGV